MDKYHKIPIVQTVKIVHLHPAGTSVISVEKRAYQ